jgi:excisionase family DNA binding protein
MPINASYLEECCVTDSAGKEYCSTKEAAVRLGVSLGTVQQMVENGMLEGWKTAGGHRRILTSSVEQFLARAIGGQAHNAKRPPSRLSVLIAEDDPVLQTLYQRTFSSWSMPIDVKIFSSGFDVLIEVGRQPPDLLITDLRMPGLDGFGMIRHIRENRSSDDLDIIAVSALTPEEIAQGGGLPADVTVYNKPVPFFELRGYLQALVIRKLHRQQGATPL